MFTDANRTSLKSWEGEIVAYEPLTTAQIENLLARLQQRFPMATDFKAPPEPPLSFGQKFLGHHEYQPPSAEEISTYQSETYPTWVRACEAVFNKLHAAAQNERKDERFHFYALNSGSRPAKDALVTIRARGNFELIAPKENDDDKAPKAELPKSPQAPRGLWAPKGFAGLAALQRAALFGVSPVTTFDMGSMMADIHRVSNIQKRDPNAFYWKPRPPKLIPVTQFVYECQQWRHGTEPETFWGHIDFDLTDETISGAIECEIHAENLTTPAKLLVPVRLTIRKESVFALAERTIGDLS
ncbi:hypothetical protein [Bradyrhizobium sp. SZCCHNS1054]|uniref:hypothetical protein n=1 Tax=Bradyrhizobium sp. SZCCHNS1054 TaxID=3057301 RepID=UPI0029170BA1|nr:hypothetical protein [Bradyrhizobium sp. SZCCHNS1054]